MDGSNNTLPKKPLLLLGARPFGLDVYDVLQNSPGWKVVGFVENLRRSRAGALHGGLPIYWVDQLAQFAKDHWAMCSLGTTRRWKFVEQAAGYGIRFATSIHASAYFSRSSALGDGSRIGVGVIVAAHANLGAHVAVNRGATVGHHTTLDDYCTVQSAVNIGGHCQIGRCSYIGMGANILDGITVGDHCVVGAGSVVTKNLPSRTMAFGVPARVVQEGIDGK